MPVMKSLYFSDDVQQKPAAKRQFYVILEKYDSFTHQGLVFLCMSMQMILSSVDYISTSHISICTGESVAE